MDAFLRKKPKTEVSRANPVSWVVKDATNAPPAPQSTAPAKFARKAAPAGVARTSGVVRKAAPGCGGPVKKKPQRVGGKTVEQHRRALGDAVKARIDVEKWCVAARTHAVVPDVDRAVFEALVVPNAADVTPARFDDATPVVVASIRSTAAMGEIFGKSKVSGGTRLGSWAADRGDVLYFPPTKELRVWWTMR